MKWIIWKKKRKIWKIWKYIYKKKKKEYINKLKLYNLKKKILNEEWIIDWRKRYKMKNENYNIWNYKINN